MKYICAALLIIVISGCAGPVIRSFPSAGYENITKSAIGDVDIFKRGHQPSKSYYSIGSIYVEKWALTTPTDLFDKDVEPLVKDAASNMGADAVVNTQYTHYFELPPSDLVFGGEFRMRASGIAVKYGESQKDLSVKHVDFLTLGFPEAGGRNAEILKEANNNVRLSIQYFLEKNGFFVSLSDLTVDYKNVDSEENLLDDMVSASNEKLPVVMYAWISSYKPDENKDEMKNKMNLIMYSKINNEIIYKNTTDVQGGGFGNIIMLTLVAGPIGLLGGLALDAMEYDSKVLITTAKAIIQPLLDSNKTDQP